MLLKRLVDNTWIFNSVHSTYYYYLGHTSLNAIIHLYKLPLDRQLVGRAEMHNVLHTIQISQVLVRQTLRLFPNEGGSK